MNDSIKELLIEIEFLQTLLLRSMEISTIMLKVRASFRKEEGKEDFGILNPIFDEEAAWNLHKHFHELHKSQIDRLRYLQAKLAFQCAKEPEVIKDERVLHALNLAFENED